MTGPDPAKHAATLAETYGHERALEYATENRDCAANTRDLVYWRRVVRALDAMAGAAAEPLAGAASHREQKGAA